MKEYKIRYTKKVTKTILATSVVTADNPEQARRMLASAPNSSVGKVIDTEVEIAEFEVKEVIDYGGKSLAEMGIKF